MLEESFPAQTESMQGTWFVEKHMPADFYSHSNVHVIFLVSLNYVPSDLLYFVAIEMLVSLKYSIF